MSIETKTIMLKPYRNGKYVWVDCPACSCSNVVLPNGGLRTCEQCGKVLVYTKYINTGEAINGK